MGSLIKHAAFNWKGSPQEENSSHTDRCHCRITTAFVWIDVCLWGPAVMKFDGVQSLSWSREPLSLKTPMQSNMPSSPAIGYNIEGAPQCPQSLFGMNKILIGNGFVHSLWLSSKWMCKYDEAKMQDVKNGSQRRRAGSLVTSRLQWASYPERMISINLSSRSVLITSFIS